MMQSMQDVKQTNAAEFNTRTRSQLYKQWQRFTAAQHSAYRIGIWGTTGAGKTTFLAMLYDALLLRAGWTIAADQNARKFITQQLRNIRTKGRFPAPTEITTTADIFRYILQEENSKRNNSEFNQITLDFVDAPGEFYENPHQADRRVEGEMDILDYLASCHGIIFLLDPDRTEDTLEDDEDDYRTMLLDLFLEFQERNLQSGLSDDLRLEPYFAFCVTKVDKEPWWSARESPQNMAEQIMGDTLYRMLGANFAKSNRFRFFSVSAIGRYQDTQTGEWVENVNYPNQAQHPPTYHNQPATQTPPVATTMSIGQAYEPDAPAPTPDPNTTYRAPRQSWAPSGQGSPSSNMSEKSPRAQYIDQVSIRKRQAIQPMNIIEPLDWLIDSIRQNPPRIMPQPKR